MTGQAGFIYGLVCPTSGLVRYVGQTKTQPRERLRHHLSKAASPLMRKWVQELAVKGQRPAIVVVSIVAYDKLDSEESKWLSHFTALAPQPLLNHKRLAGNTRRVFAIELQLNVSDLARVCTSKQLTNKAIVAATGVCAEVVANFLSGKKAVWQSDAEAIANFIQQQ